MAGMCGRNYICIFGKSPWVRFVQGELAVGTRRAGGKQILCRSLAFLRKPNVGCKYNFRQSDIPHK